MFKQAGKTMLLPGGKARRPEKRRCAAANPTMTLPVRILHPAIRATVVNNPSSAPFENHLTHATCPATTATWPIVLIRLARRRTRSGNPARPPRMGKGKITMLSFE